MTFIRKLGMALMLCICASSAAVAAEPLYDKARGETPVMETTKPPVLGNAINDDVRRTRNYAQQPPVIPHRIDGYQVEQELQQVSGLPLTHQGRDLPGSACVCDSLP